MAHYVHMLINTAYLTVHAPYALDIGRDFLGEIQYPLNKELELLSQAL